jgi:ATP-dependent DNA ligase
MLARLTRTLPENGFFYEPKWDGFRCLAFVGAGDEPNARVDLRSRHERPFSRYFPEIVEALAALDVDDVVLDGEIVAVVNGKFDFAALMGRLHPAASRVERLRHEVPCGYVCFDLLQINGEVLTEGPFAERRARLESLLRATTAPLFLTPSTRDVATAASWLERFSGGGLDGVVAKHEDLRYQPGARAMIKIKREQTADCVVAGMRPTLDGSRMVASLLLALFDEAGRLQHIGVASNFPRAQRAEMFEKLRPLAVPISEHPWRAGFLMEGGSLGRLAGSAGRWTPDMELEWIPLRPDLVCEIAFDQVDGYRLRHPARFKRWRPDREAASCTVDQIVPPESVIGEVIEL